MNNDKLKRKTTVVKEPNTEKLATEKVDKNIEKAKIENTLNKDVVNTPSDNPLSNSVEDSSLSKIPRIPNITISISK